MRTARTLVAGAALTACLAIAAPAAHAAGAVNIYDPSGQGSSSSSSSPSDEGGKYSRTDDTGAAGSSAVGEDSQQWAGKGDDDGSWQKPHGGMHTGGGGMSLGGGSSLAAGSVLLLGGLGAGAYVLRRRRGTAGAGAVA
jgi:hypothetical protein